MERKLKAAVIGCGRMGAFTSETILKYSPACCLPLSHADAISSHPRLLLTALSDTDPILLNKAAAKFGVDRRHSDSFELLRSERPALLGLATRTLGRAELIKAAVETGTHAIHAEKPLCNSVVELHSLAGILHRPDVFLTWGAIRRFFSVYRQALALATSGRYGSLREVRVHMGSAALYWTHPHSIDLLLFAAAGKRIDGVQARLANVVNDGALVRCDSDPRIVSASVYFEGGFAGHITQAIGCDFILSCEDGEIAVRGDGGKLELYTSNGSIYPSVIELEIESSTSPTGTLGPISQLVQCLDADPTAIKANLELKRDILAAQSIAFAMLQSHLEGSRIIEPSSIDPSMVIHAKTNGRYA
jgi:scyllo-inositol 2-dehydrogenase (NAD+)